MLRTPVAMAALALCAAPLRADSADDAADALVVPIIGGTVKLDVRARYEHADIGGFAPSNAWTLRTRLGYGTQPWQGLSAYVEMENIATADSHAYFDGIPPNRRGKSVVADPTDTHVNQAYALVDRPEFGKWRVVGGRQRIVLDDHRFIGNVGWRQNEQTYDGAWAQTALGVDGLAIGYGYVADVRRIFGNQGPRATRDFDSNSHVARIAYEALPWFRPVAFAYLLDLRDAPVESSNSYGVRATGTAPLGGDWSLVYQGTYAYQTDGGTSGGTNPVDYHAHYALGDLAIAFAPLGTVGGGYELLGSDDGRARFATPHATAHKFNGWADVFLNNGGTNGLQDAYAYASPALPWKLVGQVVYHQFWSHERSRELGREIDALISRKFGAHLVLLAKMAWYDDGGNASPPDTTRFWLEATVSF